MLPRRWRQRQSVPAMQPSLSDLPGRAWAAGKSSATSLEDGGAAARPCTGGSLPQSRRQVVFGADLSQARLRIVGL